MTTIINCFAAFGFLVFLPLIIGFVQGLFGSKPRAELPKELPIFQPPYEKPTLKIYREDVA